MLRAPSTLLTAVPRALEEVRAAGPLVQCLTNTVTVNLVANTLLALGAAPAMADLPGEAGTLAGVADAVYVNLGTPGAEQRAGMLEAARACDTLERPWVLDPVAVGPLALRTTLAAQLLELRPTVVRGNASEIRALAGTDGGGRGVDATHDVEDSLDAARAVAARTGGVVAVSGPVDLVTDRTTVVRVANGHPLLTHMTGGGCALGGIVAAFVGVHDDTLEATVAACGAYTVAAERAAQAATGPGSFAVRLLDELALLDAPTLAEAVRFA
ncbi:hydroxyethylthiazole kinase [Sanguibacter massiliensis]|uniref:hydroxyethylthiazole kinase n=1 Tax=Sanguibacter massiliensis TaxID=1973217 RepID=UPI000C82D5C8|nr:hydroxyethylthiazole kinase [Sanguibacter massiliensis]